MNTIKIWGSSDDLVEFENVFSAIDYTADSVYTTMSHGNRAEFNCNEHAVFLIGGQVLVVANYERNGTWEFTVGMRSEDAGFPDWPVRIKKSENNSYSMEVEIDVPMDRVDVSRMK